MGATARKREQDIGPSGWNQSDIVSLVADLVDTVSEMQTKQGLLVTAYNALRNHTMNRAHASAVLAIGGTTTSYKHTTQIAFSEAGILKLSATTADHAFTAADVITLDKWGAWVVTLAGTTWKSTRVGAATMAYATEAAAIAAIATMTVPANEAVIGYITVRARSTVDFTAGTTTLTADNGSGNAQTVNYYNGGFQDQAGLNATAGSGVLAALTAAPTWPTTGTNANAPIIPKN